MKNFSEKSKFYLLHKNVDVGLMDMPIIWLTFSGRRCIIIGIEETNGFYAKIGIHRYEWRNRKWKIKYVKAVVCLSLQMNN